MMSALCETHIDDVITLCFLVLKCLYQFSCSSYQNQGSPSTIKLLLPTLPNILQLIENSVVNLMLNVSIDSRQKCSRILFTSATNSNFYNEV